MKALLCALLLAAPIVEEARGQVRTEELPAYSAGGLFGSHGIGAEFEYRFLTPLAVVARIESTTGRISHVLATGLRLDIQRHGQLAIYGSALAGGLQCVHDVSNEEATTCTTADTFRRLAAGLVGLEAALSSESRAAFGLEAGYWHVFAGGSNTRLSHVGGAVTVRYRISPR